MFPSSQKELLPGTLNRAEIRRRFDGLSNLDIDSYIETVVVPAEELTRPAAPGVIRRLGRVVEEHSAGPFFTATLELEINGDLRSVGFIAQDRAVENGIWMPEHHLMAADQIELFSRRRIPIVTLMDTPGANATEEANKKNQAHSISRLIAEASNVDVPNVGVIFGIGYSGGAIPLAASNMILSVRDGVFSTIQPKSLASIARRLNLSWQECAKYVGLSPFELYMQGNIDGVIDYSPLDEDVSNLRLAIVSAIATIEKRTAEFVADNPYIMEHYRESLGRYLKPSAQLKAMQTKASLNLTKNPTEYLNVFGVAFRYLRYLKVRQRIKATTVQAYGRLADQELPRGEMDIRADLERRQTFLKWLQDPDKVVYDEALSKAWKNFNEKKQAVHDERGRIAQFIFGEPKKNYETARTNLITAIGVFLYNRWKAESVGNLRALSDVLEHHEDIGQLLRVSDISEPRAMIRTLRVDSLAFDVLRSRFSYTGKKLLADGGTTDKSDAYLSSQLTSELNLALTGGDLIPYLAPAITADPGKSEIAYNRELLQQRYGRHINPRTTDSTTTPFNELTVLDILIDDDLRDDFVKESQNLLLFDSVYDQIIANLDVVAEEAQSTQALSEDSLAKLLDTTVSLAAQGLTLGTIKADTSHGKDVTEILREQMQDWYLRLLAIPKGDEFFRAVEEWKKVSFPHLSDTLFVVVTNLFETLLNSFIHAKRGGKAYQGKIAPKNIGRKKDFWNRLNIAYRDLLMQNVLRGMASQNRVSYEDFIEMFFTGWEEKFGDLMSADPCGFPGFRLSIEAALNANRTPCGVITGIANFKTGDRGFMTGVVLSNQAFQAGAFDMASAEKFCRLLVECAEQHLPVICFISSGGMQTKEGAGALFSMAAVNDRITRFVRDHDLPVIVFGYGDCTGGAQASFVTHPLVQTYYLSGTSMPFAGQIVVPSNLPLNSMLSNYLSQNEGSMQGLVQNPFQPELDIELRKIDENIPVPSETVFGVVERIMSGSLIQQPLAVVARRPKYSEAELVRPIKRVLIHARGCTAAKLIRVAQARGLEVVLVQSDPDMESAAVDQLTDRDEVVCIGGNTPDESYLNAMSVLNVAEHQRVDALHPGIGFLSENSQFAELCRAHGINFIGPPVSSMDTMGNKSNAINTALRLKVPVVPGSHGILTSAERAADVAEQIGYPVLIKAVHGGGGKGIQVVENASKFQQLFHRVTAEARAAFGNGDVYLEKYVTSLRHIEVQLLRDHHGNTKVLGLRDCSVQRDKQKVFEESSSTMLPPHLEASVLAHSAALADEVKYIGAGTVEFIYDLDSDAIYFMEMNTRLQVEHPVTEWVSGVDIVGEQFRIAAGESIAELQPAKNGYAIEARINAERLQLGSDGGVTFKPHPGRVVRARFPEEAGVEVIASVADNKFVSPYYDSMVAQIIVHSETRESAINKLSVYLSRVKITGICTNIPLLQTVLKDKVFRDGKYDTNYLPELLGRINTAALISEIDASAGEQAGEIDLEAIRIEDSDELKVLSPTTAIFYTTPTPSEPPFVHVGDVIGVDDTIGQLEAMKIFSPLRLSDFNSDAEVYAAAGKFEITRINMANGQQVNVGDLLFVVKPL